jgi:hypothetical protein
MELHVVLVVAVDLVDTQGLERTGLPDTASVAVEIVNSHIDIRVNFHGCFPEI